MRPRALPWRDLGFALRLPQQLGCKARHVLSCVSDELDIAVRRDVILEPDIQVRHGVCAVDPYHAAAAYRAAVLDVRCPWTWGSRVGEPEKRVELSIRDASPSALCGLNERWQPVACRRDEGKVRLICDRTVSLEEDPADSSGADEDNVVVSSLDSPWRRTGSGQPSSDMCQQLVKRRLVHSHRL